MTMHVVAKSLVKLGTMAVLHQEMHKGKNIAERCCKKGVDDVSEVALDITIWHVAR